MQSLDHVEILNLNFKAGKIPAFYLKHYLNKAKKMLGEQSGDAGTEIYQYAMFCYAMLYNEKVDYLAFPTVSPIVTHQHCPA